MKSLFFSFFLLSTISFFSFGQSLNDYSELGKKAEELFNEKKYDEAISHYNQLIRLRPDNYFNYLMKGRSLYFIGEIEGAFEHLDIALEKNPDKAEVYYFRSLFYSLEALDEKAMNDIRNALLLDHENIDYLFTAARHSSKAAYYGRAIKLYEKIKKKGFSHPDIYYFTGYSYLMIGDSINALKNLNLAINKIKQIEQTPHIVMLKSAVLSALGKEKEALRNILNLIEKNPNLPYSYIYASDSYRIFRQWDKGLEMINKALELKRNDHYALTHKALFLTELDSLNAAKKILDNLIEKHPNSYNVLITISYLYIKLNQTEPILNWLNTAINIRPNHPGAYKVRAEYYFAINEITKGCEDVQTAIAKGHQRMYNNNDAKKLKNKYCD